MVRLFLATLTGTALLVMGTVTAVSQAATHALGLALETGTSPRWDVNVRRLNVGGLWAIEDRLAGGWLIRLRGELALGRMRARYATPNGQRCVNQVSVRGVVRMLAPIERRWFLETGTGPSYLSDPVIGQLDLGHHLQFRSHIGAGSFLDRDARWWLAYRYSHTFNADLGSPNPGINFHLLHLGHAF